MAAGSRPVLVLQSLEHRGDLDDLTPGQAGELGSLLRTASGAIQRLTGAGSVYVLYFNEIVPPHVHFHLVPRFSADPDSHVGADLLGQPLPRRVKPIDGTDLAARVASACGSATQSPHEPSALVGLVLRVFRSWEFVSLYHLLFRRPPLVWLTPAQRAEVYVPSWTALLLALLVSLGGSSWGSAWGWLVACVAGYRFIDIVAYHVPIILDRRANALVSYTRSLVLVAFNVVELGLVNSILLRWRLGHTFLVSLLDGFSIATMRGDPAAGGTAIRAVIAVGTVGSIILFVGALSLLIGLIGQSFHEADET